MVSLGLGGGYACKPHALWQKTTLLLQDSPSRPGSFSYWVSAHSIQHTYTSTFPIPRDTYISFSAVQLPFLAFAANTEFIHRAPHCCCGTEEKNLSWSSCPFYWRCGGMLWWLQGGRLASFIHRQNHPSTSLATMEAASFYPFSLGATNVKKNLSHLNAFTD